MCFSVRPCLGMFWVMINDPTRMQIGEGFWALAEIPAHQLEVLITHMEVSIHGGAQ